MKDYGPVYESEELTVYHFERVGSEDGVDVLGVAVDFVVVGLRRLRA